MDKIYKYVPLDINTFKLLVTGHLYLASPSNLNDPFESEFELEKIETLPDINILKGIFKDQKIDITKINQDNFHIHLKKYLKEYLDNNYGITCFSELNNDIRMWSHYSNSHKGICLEFDGCKLAQSEIVEKIGLKLENIKTSDRVPMVQIVIENGILSFSEESDIALWKFIHWEDEKEIRLHGDLSKLPYIKNGKVKRTIPFDKGSLTGIILGEKITEEDADLLAHLVNNDKELQHLKWYKAQKDFNQSKMNIDLFGGFAIIKSINIQKAVSEV